MHRLLVVLLIGTVILSSVGCTAPTKEVNGVTYQDYGLFNPDDRNPKVRYEPNWANIIIAVVFFELIIPPLYVLGWHLYKPVGPAPATAGQVS